ATQITREHGAVVNCLEQKDLGNGLLQWQALEVGREWELGDVFPEPRGIMLGALRQHARDDD
ncbi:MAG: hypothetical protein LN413_08315, partial [Candidatus Thermoplasmatota archaeon]|nr:hypothetical protein [Candidatus Thermoplasmatota archaeon]